MKEPVLRRGNLPDLSGAGLEWSQFNLDRDELFEGVTLRRAGGFCIDFCINLVILAGVWVIVIFSLGLFTPILALTPFLPIAYHTLLVGGQRSATLGMQFTGVEVRNHDGARPSLLQAFVMTALFYASITLLTPLILLVALLNDRRRCVHDILSGTTVVLTDPKL